MMGDGLRLRLLGRFEVEGIEPRRLGTRKARTLLRALAVARGAAVPIDTLADRVWGDELPADPAAQLAVLVSRLRAVIGAAALRRVDGGYALDAAWIDVDAAEELAAEAERRLAGRRHASARAAASAALALMRGPLLPEEADADWLDGERSSAARREARVRRLAAAAALAAGDVATAVALAADALDRDPHDEEAARLAMAALTASGRRASALDLHERLRRRLADDLGVDPSAETEAAHRALLRGQPVPGVVTAASGAGAGPAAGDLRAAPPGLPGRAGELEALDAAFGAAAAGRATLVTVEGEAGIGKTRLVEAWSSGLAARGVTVLGERCDDLGGALSLQAVIDAVSAHLGSLPPEARTRLLDADRAMLAPLLGLAPAAARSPSALSAAGGGGDPAAGQLAVFRALLDLLERIARDGPVVLVIEDVHLAGRATPDWLRFAARQARDAPLLLVATRRSEEGAPLGLGAVIRPGPLDLEAATAVVGAEAAAELLSRSGGNPLLLTELAGAARYDEVPDSLRDAVAARCDRAGAAAASLRAAAVLGPEVDLDLLAAVLRLPPIDLLDHLEEGVRRHFLEERGRGFAFRHDLVREALVAGTGVARRALLHREAARALAERPAPEPLRVAYHAAGAGEQELASRFLVDAARVALTRHDLAEAGELLDRALGHHDAPAARLERGRLQVMLGDYAAARDDAGRALAMGAGAEALEIAAFAAWYGRDVAAAASLADQGARLATTPEVRARCLLVRGRTECSAGDLGRADASLEEATHLARRSGGDDSPAVYLALLRAHRGRAAQALRLLRIPAPAGEGGSYYFAPLHRQFTAAYALGTLGRAGESLAAVERLDAEGRRQQVTRFAARVDNLRGWVLRNAGEPGAGAERHQQAAESAERTGYSEAAAYAWLDLADAALQEGDPDLARARLDRAAPHRLVPQVHRWRLDLVDRLHRARVLLAEGEVERAAEESEALAEDAAALDCRRYLVRARLLGVQAAARGGAALDLGRAEAWLEELGEVAGLEAWWLTAELARDAGVERWWELARERVARLAASAGEMRPGFERHAAQRLERLGADR